MTEKLTDTSQAERWIDSNTFVYHENIYIVDARGKVARSQRARRRIIEARINYIEEQDSPGK